MPELPETVTDLFIDRLGADFKVRQVTALGGGCINHAVKVESNQGNYFVKWNQNCPPDFFEREAECLEELAKPGSILKIPQVIASKSLDDGPAVLITEFLREPESGSSGQDEILGRGLAEIHQFRQDKFGFYHDNYCGLTRQDNQWNQDWIDFFSRQRLLYLLNLVEQSRSLGGREKKIYENFLAKLPERLGHNPEPVLIHGDLWSGNYMYTSDGPAIIDPACCYADREFDLSITVMFGGFSRKFWSAYQEAYPFEPEWKERNELYMIYHYLNHYHLFGGSYGNQAMNIADRFS
jgi:fructosamine-3-kinase